MHRCYGCGVVKNLNNLEASPYHKEDGLCDSPIPPLNVIECQSGGPGFGPDTEFRVVVVCHECFHKLSPDMWISERCWESINPDIPFSVLPTPVEEEEKMWDAASYPLKNKQASWCIRHKGKLMIRNYGDVVYDGLEADAPLDILKLAEEFKN